MSERSEVTRPLLEALNALPGAMAFRLNSGVAKRGGRTIMLCPIGTPDILAVIHGRAVFFETKLGRGKATDEQIDMHSRLRRTGALVFVVDSVAKGVEIGLRISRKGGKDGDYVSAREET